MDRPHSDNSDKILFALLVLAIVASVVLPWLRRGRV